MDTYDHDYKARLDEKEHANLYAKQSPKMLSLADEVRGLQNQGNCLREDIERLSKLLAETREELAMLSQRTFGQDQSR